MALQEPAHRRGRDYGLRAIGILHLGVWLRAVVLRQVGWLVSWLRESRVVMASREEALMRLVERWVATRGAGLAHDLELLPLLMRAAEAPRLPTLLLVGGEGTAAAWRATALPRLRPPRPEQRRLWNLRGSEMNSQQAIKA